jgi:O-antigen ligase
MQHTPNKLLKDTPFYTFLLLVFIKPFISSMAFPLVNAIFWSLLYLDLCAMLVFDKKFTFLGKAVLNSPMLFFLALLLINQFFSINIYNSLTELVYFISYILTFSIATQFSKEEKTKLILAIIISGCFISIYGLYQYFFGIRDTLKIISANPNFPNISNYARDFLLFKRVFATFFSPDKLAAFLLYIIFLSLGISFLPNLKTGIKIFITINFFISTLALVLSKSAGGIAAFIICFFVLLALMLYNRNREDKTFVLALSVILIIVSVCAILIIKIRLDETIKSYNIKNSIAQRLDYWKAAIDIIKDFPLKGIGLGNFKVLYTKYKSALSDETYYAHNSYLQIFCETGFLGFIILLVLFFSFIKLSFTKIKHNNVKNLDVGIFCAVMTFIVRNFFDYDLYLPELTFLWCICAGLMIPFPTIKKNTKLNNLLCIPLFMLLLVFQLSDGISLKLLKNSQNLLFNKEYEDSAKTLEKAVLFMPINDQIYNRLAKSYELLVNKDRMYFEKALNRYEKAISLNYLSAYNHADLGLFFSRNNMTDEAISELKNALELYPTKIEFCIYLQEAISRRADSQRK